MAAILEALKPIFVNGRIVDIGSKFSCSHDFAKKLVENESAKLVTQDEQTNDNPEENRKKLKALTKDELLKIAQEKGIDGLSENNKKDEIIDALLKVAD